MKYTRVALFILLINLSSAYAQEDSWSYMDSDLHPGDQVKGNLAEIKEAIRPSKSLEVNDPFEDINRGIYWVNGILDYFFIERVSEMYRGVIPQYGRERVGYVLRNLSEPVVFVNNILQGEMDDAAETLARFVVNSTIGLAGIFDISTDWGFEYKKEDFGLTLAFWGVDPGPYLILPILGPSNLRDSVGRIGDYAFDPINWWSYIDDLAVVCNSRTGAQILDAKTDNLDLLAELRQSSIDEYATIRAWYHERREALRERHKALMTTNEDHRTLESPQPDEDED